MNEKEQEQMASYPEIKIGDQVEILTPLYDIFGREWRAAGERGVVGEHPQQGYPNLIIWFAYDPVSWADPFEDLQPNEWRLL